MPKASAFHPKPEQSHRIAWRAARAQPACVSAPVGRTSDGAPAGALSPTALHRRACSERTTLPTSDFERGTPSREGVHAPPAEYVESTEELTESAGVPGTGVSRGGSYRGGGGGNVRLAGGVGEASDGDAPADSVESAEVPRSASSVPSSNPRAYSRSIDAVSDESLGSGHTPFAFAISTMLIETRRRCPFSTSQYGDSGT